MVDGLGNETHQPDAAAAIHQVDLPGHLRSFITSFNITTTIPTAAATLHFLQKNALFNLITRSDGSIDVS